MNKAVELYKLFLKFYNQLHTTQLSLKESQLLTLTTSEDHYLGIIYDLDNPSFSEFAKVANISKPAATKIIRNFIDNGYLTKVQSQRDRRSYSLILYENVNAFFKTTDDAFVEVLKERLDTIDELELDIFTNVLLKLLNEGNKEKA